MKPEDKSFYKRPQFYYLRIVLKKTAIILLLCIYSFSSFGIGIKQFYCCGKLKSTTLSLVQEIKQKCVNGNETSGCCKTQYHSFKVKDSHFATDGIDITSKYFTNLSLLIPAFETGELAIAPKNIANASHAPPHYKVSIYIFNCVYLI